MQTRTDGRGVAKTTTYDDFLRPSIISASGTNNEYNLTITNQFDRRGLLTNTVQSFASTNTGPQTRVRRAFDAYGHIINEWFSIGSEQEKQAAQAWDSAGRRSTLYFPPALDTQTAFRYTHQADGQMIWLGYANSGTSYTYSDNGLLLGKDSMEISLAIDQRDGRGRVLHRTTRFFGALAFTEALGWRNDGRLASYSAGRSDFTDVRTYGYSAMARRLTNESLTVGSSQQITNSFGVDLGQSGKLGVLTSAAQSGAFAATWSVPSSGGLDGLRRVSTEQDTLFERPATGRAIGAAVLSGTLNGRPLALEYDSGNTNGTWRANMELSPGQNTLVVSATHPSGLYSTAATNIFTNAISGADAVSSTFDGNGNFTVRVKRDGSNNVLTTQTLVWDANDRLIKATERDSQNSGYDWAAICDPLGRRLRTTYTLVVTNAPQPSPTLVDSWFDPEVEFLEVGVAVNGEAQFKGYGPDLSGGFGGMQGVGGLDVLLNSSPFAFGACPVISDQFGNVVASMINPFQQNNSEEVLVWSTSRVGAYGPVAGYPALPLERNKLYGDLRLAPTLTWRGLRIDPTGFYWLGARYYDPESRRFLSADPMGFAGGSDLQGFCQGDPVNFFDPDGRFGKPANSGTSAADIFGRNGGNVNASDLLAWGMQNPNARITGSDNASGWLGAGQAMASGTLPNPQYINGYTDEFGHNAQSFCYSCHDPNDAFARLKLGAAFNTVNTSIPAFLAQNALAFAPAEGMLSEAEVAAQILYHYTSDAGRAGINESRSINASLNPLNARYGPGQYFTDIAPTQVGGRTVADLTSDQVAAGQISQGQLARQLFGQPWAGNKLNSYFAIDVTGLPVNQVAPNIFLNSGTQPLNVAGRIIGSGATLGAGYSAVNSIPTMITAPMINAGGPP